MSESERPTPNHTWINRRKVWNMDLLKVEVKKNEPKGYTLILWGRDNAGHILTSSVVAPDPQSIPVIVLDATHSLAVVAAEVTEEEQFKEKKNK